MPRLTLPARGSRPPTTVPNDKSRDGDKAAARDELFAALEELTTRWKLLLGIAVPTYAFIRILVLTRADESVILEVVRRQGVSGIAEAAFTSVTVEIAGLAFLGLLIFFAWLVDSERSPSLSRWRIPLLTAVALLAAALGIAVIPWTMTVAVLIVALLAWGAVSRGWSFVAYGAVGAAALAVMLVGPVLSAPWMPFERLSWEGSSPQVSSGYVLGDGQGFVSVLEAERGHDVVLIPSNALRGREVCRPESGWFSFDAPSALEALLRGRTPACEELRPKDSPPTSIVMCIDQNDDRVVRVVALPERCGPTMTPIVVNQKGPKGDRGDEGPPGRPGDPGEPGAKHAWAFIGPGGDVESSSHSATAHTSVDQPTLHVVRFEGLDLRSCAVTAQSASRAAVNSALLLNVVIPHDGSGIPIDADPAAGDIVIEGTVFGKDGAAGYFVLATCPA